MKFFTDILEAFRDGILGASSNGRFLRRMIALLLLTALSVGCVILAVVCFVNGLTIRGFTFSLNSITFAFLAISVIYQASTSETYTRIDRGK